MQQSTAGVAFFSTLPTAGEMQTPGQFMPETCSNKKVSQNKKVSKNKTVIFFIYIFGTSWIHQLANMQVLLQRIPPSGEFSFSGEYRLKKKKIRRSKQKTPAPVDVGRTSLLVESVLILVSWLSYLFGHEKSVLVAQKAT